MEMEIGENDFQARHAKENSVSQSRIFPPKVLGNPELLKCLFCSNEFAPMKDK